MNGFDDHLITLDIDWASDEVIGHCADMLITARVKATWLVTHDSPKVRELAQQSDLFELGIHPNFLPGSTQGDTPKAILEHVLAIVPDARSVRTHDLVQSTTLIKMMCQDFGIEHDLSLLLPDTPDIRPHVFHLPAAKITRLPTFWEDDAEMLRPQPVFSLADHKFHFDGLKVFTFHPIHVALNSASLSGYERLKAENHMGDVSMEVLAPFAHDGPGAGTLFGELIELIGNGPDAPGRTVSEVADDWRASGHD